MQKTNKIAIVVGAGSEWRQYKLGEVDHTKYDVIRVNNFFFEDQFYFGARVDYLFYGGDRYLLPDYVNTLKRAVETGYSIGEIVIQKGLKNRKSIELFNKMGFSIKLFSVQARASNYRPTTGMVALQWALSMGYKSVLALNFDFYKNAGGYPFLLTGMARRVLKNKKAGYGSPFHKKQIDMVFLQDSTIRYGCSTLEFVNFNDAIAIFKFRGEENIVKKNKLTDWERTRGSSKRMFVRSVILSLKSLKSRTYKN